MPVHWESALRKANDLKDEKLYAALQLSEGDMQLETLLQPLFDSANNGVDVPSDESRRPYAMCPDLYRATLSGSINKVNELLGLRKDKVRINNAGNETTEVKVLLEEPYESQTAMKSHWGGRVHGNGHCMLQEITAEKNTVLHIAAEEGHVDLVEQIVRRDNNLLLSENSRHESPLHLAARAGNHRIVSLILFLAQESGIGAYEVLTKKSIQGDTILHEAARHGHEEVVKVLMIVAPALSAEVNNSSIAPLYLAALRKSVGVVQALIQYKHTSAIGPKQQNALHAAVLGSPEIASILLDWKAELANERDVTGSTPMHYAASSTGDVTVVKNILNKMPWAVYIQDKEGLSPLHVAARMCNYSSIHYMIDYCPDSIEIYDNHGRNFLHIVAQHCGEEINLNDRDQKKFLSMIKLVKKSSDLKRLVNKMDNEGNTPLHFASMNGFSEVALRLLKKTEADTVLINNEGKTALDNVFSSRMNFFLMASTVATLSSYGAIFSPQRQDKLIKNWTDITTKWIDKVSENLIVVSVLIATIAFSAAFNVPGSYNSDGVATFSRNLQYQIFIILDSIAMSTSVSAAILLVVAKTVSKRGFWSSFSRSLVLLWISLFTMELAFVMAVSVSLGSGITAVKIIINATSIFFFVWTVIVMRKIGSPTKLRTIRRFLSSVKKQTPTARQIDIQFPMLVSYATTSQWFNILNFIFYMVTIGISNLLSYS